MLDPKRHVFQKRALPTHPRFWPLSITLVEIETAHVSCPLRILKPAYFYPTTQRLILGPLLSTKRFADF